MRFLEYLNEEYYKLVQSFKTLDPTEVFVNPSRSELKELWYHMKKSKSTLLRYLIVLKPMKVYIWDGANLLHMHVAKEIHLSDYDPQIRGQGTLATNSTIDSWDATAYGVRDSTDLRRDLGWISKYIDTDILRKVIFYDYN